MTQSQPCAFMAVDNFVIAKRDASLDYSVHKFLEDDVVDDLLSLRPVS